MINKVTDEILYTCGLCQLRFTNSNLKELHGNTPAGTFKPPVGLVYEDRVGNYRYVIFTTDGGYEQKGDRLHQPTFGFKSYFLHEKWRENDQLGIRGSNTASLIFGLKKGVLKLLDQEEFEKFKSSRSAFRNLQRTTPELEALIA